MRSKRLVGEIPHSAYRAVLLIERVRPGASLLNPVPPYHIRRGLEFA